MNSAFYTREIVRVIVKSHVATWPHPGRKLPEVPANIVVVVQPVDIQQRNGLAPVYVEGVIQVRPMFTLAKTGTQPVWRIDSWASSFDQYLADDGIFLGDYPPEISFSNINDQRPR